MHFFTSPCPGAPEAMPAQVGCHLGAPHRNEASRGPGHVAAAEVGCKKGPSPSKRLMCWRGSGVTISGKVLHPQRTLVGGDLL